MALKIIFYIFEYRYQACKNYYSATFKINFFASKITQISLIFIYDIFYDQ